MIRRSQAGPIVAMLLSFLALSDCPLVAPAAPGDDEKDRKPASAPALELAGIDFVVIVWYRGNEALGTFKYQTYDVRKGEYTPAMDDWIAMMRRKYPDYVVRVHRVVLARERGDTEPLKVGSVIHRDLLGAAALSGVVLGEPLRVGPGPSAASRPAARTFDWSQPPGAGGQSYLNSPGTGSPFPVPYPRPHP